MTSHKTVQNLMLVVSSHEPKMTFVKNIAENLNHEVGSFSLEHCIHFTECDNNVMMEDINLSGSRMHPRHKSISHEATALSVKRAPNVSCISSALR